MKVILKNFRCYSEKEIDLGENGLTLLLGQSGAGKSTILMAIYFCLYGEGTKCVSNGKTSCEVTIIFENFFIKRTKRPNRVVVKDSITDEEYEDDSAQSLIDKIFGKNFNTVSYLQQNAYNSFILMNPSEKLNFIENFSFTDIDLQNIKSKIQALIKEKNENLISVTSKLQMSEEYFKTISKPRKVNFPINTKNIELASKNEHTKLKNTKILLKRSLKKLEEITLQSNNLKILNVKLQSIDKLINSNQEKLLLLQDEKSKINYRGDSFLKSLEETLKKFLDTKEYFQLEKIYKENLEKYSISENIEKQETEKTISEIETNLWKEYEKSEIDPTIEYYEKMLEDVKVINKLSKNILTDEEQRLENMVKEIQNQKDVLERLKEQLKTLEFQKEVYKCPSCNSNLKFENKTLCIFSEKLEEKVEIDTVKKEIINTSKKISNLETNISKLKETIAEYKKSQKIIEQLKGEYEELDTEETINTNLDYLRNYKIEQVNMEKKKTKLQDNLKNQKFSTSLTSMKKDLLLQKQKLHTYSNITSENIDEEEIRSDIIYQKQYKQKLYELKNQEEKIFFEIGRDEKVKNTLTKELNEINIESVDENNIENIKSGIEKYNSDITLTEETIQKIEQYEKYIQDCKIYNEWDEKVNNLKKNEEVAKKDYAASTLLKEKVLQAESISIVNIVNSINTHAQEYLNTFFPNDPISVRLVAFKETKKSVKPQINIEIDYKGMDVDINMLSGGELSRVVLAYTLALSEIFNSKIILLDECTSSLDQELTTTVIEGIKSNFPDKLIVIIAHQVVSGIFDKEISI